MTGCASTHTLVAHTYTMSSVNTHSPCTTKPTTTSCFTETNYDPLPLQFVSKLQVKDRVFNLCIYKAQRVVMGSLQYAWEYGETFAPTAKLWIIRTITTIAAQEGLKTKKCDLTGAFLVADTDCNAYVEISCYHIPRDKTIHLMKALYSRKSKISATRTADLLDQMLAAGVVYTASRQVSSLPGRCDQFGGCFQRCHLAVRA